MIKPLEPEVYSPRGLLAVLPSALGMAYGVNVAAPELFTSHGNRALVRISGPLAYEAGQGLDTYAAIRCRAQAALASSALEVVLYIASPGGDVNGLFDAARGIRDDATAAGKRLIAFSDATVASSAYALAAACDEVYCSDTATLGSIGVIAVLPDMSLANAAQGVVVNIITSGERKADGNPMAPMGDAARAAVQQSVDAMAGVFFQHVADRRGLSVDVVRSYQAGVFVGQAAVDAGLANAVSSLDALLARPLGTSALAAAEHTTLATDSTMADKDEDKKDKLDARAALVAASEDPEEKDDVKRARAKRALAAYDAEMEEDEKKEEGAKAAASADVAAVSSLAATVQAQGAELAALRAERESANRAAFMATRPDLNPELVKTLASLPLDRVKAIVAGIPAGNTLATTQSVSATVVGAHTQAAAPVIGTNDEMNSRMGLPTTREPRIQRDGSTVTFRSMSNAEAREHLKTLPKELQ